MRMLWALWFLVLLGSDVCNGYNGLSLLYLANLPDIAGDFQMNDDIDELAFVSIGILVAIAVIAICLAWAFL